MHLLYHLCGHVWRLAIVRILNSIINSFRELVDGERGINQLVHLEIVRLQIYCSNIPVTINEVLKEVLEH